MNVRQFLRRFRIARWSLDGTGLINMAGATVPMGGGGGGTPPTTVGIAGVKNGVNTAFTLGGAVPASWCAVYLNGSRLKAGVGYTRVGGAITALAPYIPDATDIYEADYV